MRTEGAKLKSRRACLIIAPGQRSGARGYGRKMISSFFLPVGGPPARQTGREKSDGVWWPFTRGGGLGGLAPGYFQTAPPGLLQGEPDAS